MANYMIYLRCEDQEDPHSDILIQIKGHGEVVGHEVFALLDHIIEEDEQLFHNIIRALIHEHRDVFINEITNHLHYDDK